MCCNTASQDWRWPSKVKRVSKALHHPDWCQIVTPKGILWSLCAQPAEAGIDYNLPWPAGESGRCHKELGMNIQIRGLWIFQSVRPWSNTPEQISGGLERTQLDPSTSWCSPSWIHCFQVPSTGCNSSGTTECPPLVVPSEDCHKDIGNSALQPSSSQFSYCANCSLQG